ncbi:hypothetical protein DBV15_02633 [Temnothorax longispinosus]|uniref:Uncharacterized protein n=1 Tax=Temnothorax longispinosus TaxID=300112 RepID=A0A4V6RGE7_9HYME|nr:hypothetical protein DBV15_02633 [Temnothorax longispinosus]
MRVDKREMASPKERYRKRVARFFKVLADFLSFHNLSCGDALGATISERKFICVPLSLGNSGKYLARDATEAVVRALHTKEPYYVPTLLLVFRETDYAGANRTIGSVFRALSCGDALGATISERKFICVPLSLGNSGKYLARDATEAVVRALHTKEPYYVPTLLLVFRETDYAGANRTIGSVFRAVYEVPLRYAYIPENIQFP